MATHFIDIKRRSDRVRRHVFVAMLLVCFLPAGSAAGQRQTLTQMDHTMWTARDGAPQGILALAQAADGTLWIGSQVGLFNFDGRTFSPFKPLPGEPQLPAEPVFSICISKDGSLWVGFLQAGAAHIAHGHVTLYPKVDSKPLGRVQDLTQTADGSIWGLSNQYQLVRFGADLSWHIEQTPEAVSRIARIFIDSSNTLWLAQGGRLYRRPLAQPAYTATDVHAGLTFGFAETPDGSIWMTDVMPDVDRGRTQHVDHLGHLLALLPDSEEAYDILYAPDGSIVLATAHGLRRYLAKALTVPHASHERLSPDVFTGIDYPRALLLDPDGNIWVGSRRGLDRFREAQLVRFVPRNPSGGWMVCASKQGALWIAGNGNQLYKLSGGATLSFSNAGDFYSLFCANDGDVWLVDHVGIWHVNSDRLEPAANVPGVPPYGVTQVVSTSDHTLYATIARAFGGGHWQYKSNKWTKIVREGVPGVGYVDSQDRLWLGRLDGLISLPLEGRLFSSGDPGLGIVRAILETSHGTFAAGSNGVAVFRENRFEMLAFADEVPSRGIGDIVESRNGDLWLNTWRGIVRVSASEMDTALERAGYRMKADLVTEGDFVGASPDTLRYASAARDADGKLWFCTLNGVVRLDPEHWRAESRPPILSIKSVVADRRPLDGRGTFPPQPQTLEIRYFGVNLTAPDQVIYRYRLEGLEDAWQDAGDRAEAIYTRLQPGTYTFLVMASNGDGVWTAPVSSRSFTVLPSFYQTTWFALLCALAGLVLLWAAFTMRVKAITRVVRARAEERADERIRIARELHDTLLQGIQGLQLTFHVAAQKMSPTEESKTMLERALATADQIIIEARNRVGGLRSERVTDAELFGSLQNAGNDLNPDGKVSYHVQRSGIGATLHSHVADEVFFMAREALTNAFRHAEASEIELKLIYGNRFFSIVCQDDGRGFDTPDCEEPGHWGLKGITERARKLGGQVRFSSKSMQGTEILVVIPSYQAYRHHSRLMFYLRALRLSERNPLRDRRT